METTAFLSVILATAIGGIAVAALLAKHVLSQPAAEENMNEVGHAILSGANAYLRRQFTTIAPIVILLALFLYFTSPNPALSLARSAAFLMGALFSGLIGTIGMNIATRTNTKVAQM